MTRIAIVIAVLCALAGAIYCSWDSYQKKADEVKRLEVAAGPLYIFAKRDLLVGSVIGEGDIVFNRLPSNHRYKSAFTEEQKKYVIGRKAKYGFSAGQIILEGQLTGSWPAGDYYPKTR